MAKARPRLWLLVFAVMAFTMAVVQIESNRTSPPHETDDGRVAQSFEQENLIIGKRTLHYLAGNIFARMDHNSYLLRKPEQTLDDRGPSRSVEPSSASAESIAPSAVPGSSFPSANQYKIGHGRTDTAGLESLHEIASGRPMSGAPLSPSPFSIEKPKICAFRMAQHSDRQSRQFKRYTSY